ncbi:molybdopterin molybdotransferase MoeA [Proteocatella sphenisci]|uniref:molybdopterin molybdotransferase MoeA n=1 Tax=Proteocatella sphenisci TaxID=181070 RepID=UPI00048B9CDE|nr:gephyrin-like molybdotransferase Glp [Proteocatella sphenisci]
MKLLKVDFVEEAIKKSIDYIKENWEIKPETVSLNKAYGRILFEDARSEEDVPNFNRSTVDGYSVIAADTYGASESIPTILSLKESVEMGRISDTKVKSGECAYVPTGGMIPEGADAMVMIEYTEIFGDDEVAVYLPVAYREGVTLKGEDVKSGSTVLKKGTHIGAKEIGVLAATGYGMVKVFPELSISIFSTGDEIIDPSEKYETGLVRDINGYGVGAMALELGMNIMRHKIIKDDENMLITALKEASKDSDIVIISGGSSQGIKDYSEKVIDLMGSPGVFTHGLAIKPGKPTIIGASDGVLYVGLPGHPVSAMIVFDVIVGDIIRTIRGEKSKPYIYAKMKTNAASAPGKQTYLLARLTEEHGEWMAEPVYGKSGLITSLSQADGYIVIDKNCEGIRKDEIVKIRQLG